MATTNWAAMMRDDPTLRAFVDAEVARAVVELDTAKHNAAHWRTIAGALEQKLQAAEAKLRDRREAAKADKQDAGLRLRLADEASCDADIVDAPESEFCRIRIKSTGEVRRIHLWAPDLGKDHEKER